MTLFPLQMTYPQPECPFFLAEVSHTPFPQSGHKEEDAGALHRGNKELQTVRKANLHLSKCVCDPGL